MIQSGKGKEMVSNSIISDGIIASTFDRKDVMEKTYLALQQAGKQIYIKDNMIVQKMEGQTAKQILELALKQIEDARKNSAGQVQVKTKIEEIK